MEVVHTYCGGRSEISSANCNTVGYLLKDTTLVLQTTKISADRGRVETSLVWQKTLPSLR